MPTPRDRIPGGSSPGQRNRLRALVSTSSSSAFCIASQSRMMRRFDLGHDAELRWIGGKADVDGIAPVAVDWNLAVEIVGIVYRDRRPEAYDELVEQ